LTHRVITTLFTARVNNDQINSTEMMSVDQLTAAWLK